MGHWRTRRTRRTRAALQLRQTPPLINNHDDDFRFKIEGSRIEDRSTILAEKESGFEAPPSREHVRPRSAGKCVRKERETKGRNPEEEEEVGRERGKERKRRGQGGERKRGRSSVSLSHLPGGRTEGRTKRKTEDRTRIERGSREFIRSDEVGNRGGGGGRVPSALIPCPSWR